MVIEEALRLYRPTAGLGRKAIAADEIGGYLIPAGSTVLLCPYTTHRHPAFWEMQLVLATIAQRYRLQLVSGHRVEPKPSFTLRTRYGLPMTLLQRA